MSGRYWTYSFEGYNRIVKKWAMHSNRKDTLNHVAKMVALKWAYMRAKDEAP